MTEIKDQDKKLVLLTTKVEEVSEDTFYDLAFEDAGNMEYMDDRKWDYIEDEIFAPSKILPNMPIHVRADVNEYVFDKVAVIGPNITTAYEEMAEIYFNNLINHDEECATMSYEKFEELVEAQKDVVREHIIDIMWDEVNAHKATYDIDTITSTEDVEEYVKEEFPDWYAEAENSI